MPSFRWAAVAGLLLAACGGTPSAEPPPAAPGAEPGGPPLATAADAAATPTQDADEVVARALDVVSRLRELSAKGPVKGRTIDRAAMVEHVKKQIRTEIPPEVVRAQAEMLFGFGVVDEKFDYETSLLSLMTSQLAGFYEPKDKTMYLAADLGELERGATLAHELVHALQDQHYDLGKHVKYRHDATDEQSAIHALAEGDATSAMLDQVLARASKRAIDLDDEAISLDARAGIEMAAADVPSIVKRSVVSPYVDGVVFVHAVRRKSGWAGVDKVWRTLPKSTEQILHPDKLAANEQPEAIGIPLPAQHGPSKEFYRDILGEQSLRLLFEEWMPRKVAIANASDWGGDRIAVFREGERFAVAWHVRYDHESGAKRGLEAFARGVLRKEGSASDAIVDAPEATAAAKPGHVCRERPKRGPFAVVRKGRDVVVVAGPYERGAGSPKSAGHCTRALAWARAIAAHR